MDKWAEMRTGFHLARLGTVSAAAQFLGVHRATIMRQIDTLEAELGGKLFVRHARGYTPTELGLELLQIAQATEDQFSQLARKARGGEGALSGELIITALEGFSTPIIEALGLFRARYPQVSVRLLTAESLFRLEYGEAHIAIRAGAFPDHPDNVVRHFDRLEPALFAHQDYIARRGRPDFAEPKSLLAHDFIGHSERAHRARAFRWIEENIPAERINFRANSSKIHEAALRAGLGIGLMMRGTSDGDLELVHQIGEEGISDLWIVTHVDLHRTAKVQAFLEILHEMREGNDPLLSGLPI